MVLKLDRADMKYANKYPEYAIPAPDLSREETRANEENPYEVVYLDDLEKRKKAYGICSECNEPGTGRCWCRPCRSKKYRENFKNWTSGNKIIDKLIQESQLNAVHETKCLRWIPFEEFEDVTFIAQGGFGKIYRARWPTYPSKFHFALKSLGSSDISVDFIHEIESHLHINVVTCVVRCYGVSQNPVSKDYIMVLEYYEGGNLRNYISNSEEQISYNEKIYVLYQIVEGLKNIHGAGKVHKDFHSGNILSENSGVLVGAFISDLGLCQPADQPKEGKIYGVLPYVAPEVLRGKQYTPASDIYSFGIVMNEFLSEEYPFGDIPHDYALVYKIFDGVRPKISKHVPKFLADVIKKCWNGEAKNRPNAKELYQIFDKFYNEKDDKNSEIYPHIIESDEKYKECKSNNKPNNNNDNNLRFTQTHPQAVFTSRMLDFDVTKLTSDLEFTLDEFDDLDQETNEE